MKNVLITGASGYIGKHITLQLLNQGYTVRASVRKLNENLDSMNLVDEARLHPELLPTLPDFALRLELCIPD